MEDLNVVNDTQDGNVDVQTDVNTDINTESDVSAGASEDINSQTNEKPVQTREENAAFKAMRLKLEAADNLAQQYGFESFEDMQIKEAERLAEERAEQERQRYLEAGMDPDLIGQAIENHPTVKKAAELLKQQQMQEFMRAEAEQLTSDPKKGEFFKQWESEIRECANQHNIGLQAAFMVVAGNKIADIAKPDVKKIKEDAVKEYLDSLRKNNKPIEGGGGSPAVVTSQPKTFEDARKGALEMMRALKNQ